MSPSPAVHNSPVNNLLSSMKKIISLLATALMLPMAAWCAKVDTVSVATTNLATPGKAVVVTPDAAATGKKFPTVYILHGFGGKYSDWIKKRADLPELADQYGMVLVMPDGRDSWYWNSLNDPQMQMESFFTDDLVPYIDANYPTLAEPAKRAITGLSMGGHGSMWLAMRHPDIWGNAGSMSGGVDILPFPDRWAMIRALGTKDENPTAWKEHSVLNLVPWVKPGELNIIFDCGQDDFFHDVNENLHHELDTYKIPHEYTVRPGNHSWGYWKNSILHHLLYFNEKFNAPKE